VDEALPKGPTRYNQLHSLEQQGMELRHRGWLSVVAAALLFELLDTVMVWTALC
jgi:hypothetical protein